MVNRGAKLLAVIMSLCGMMIAFQNCSGGHFESNVSVLASDSNQIQSETPPATICTEGQTQTGYLTATAVYPNLCGAAITKSCIGGKWTRSENLSPSCLQHCVHPDTNQSVGADSSYVYYSIPSGTLGQCDAARITSLCQESTGTFEPYIPPNRFTSCAMSGGTGPNAVVAGVLSSPYPTLENLSIEWLISGDQNMNSSVGVRYRKMGDTVWRSGMALKLVPAGSNEGNSWVTRHTGSLFDLEPATHYQIELTLNDPDGGSAIQTLTASTRAVPMPLANGTVKTAAPNNIGTVLSGAKAGDIIQLSSGNYSGFQIGVSGEEGKPITIRGMAGATINGEIGIFEKNHIYLEGLSVVGRIRYNGSKNISVVRSKVQGTTSYGGDGIVTYTRSENSYIADNVVTGTTTWAETSLGVNGNNLGEGICVNGPGHVIMNNRVSGFRDSISLMEDSEARDQQSIDIINNEISVSADDGIEADFCKQNCRVMRNYLTNSFIALSSQPSLGGPTYFIRNVVYNAVHLSFKLYRGSIGDVILHNTIVKNGDGLGVYAGRAVSRALIANNIFLGGAGGSYNGYSSGTGRVVSFPDLVTTTSYINYQAYGSATGSFTGSIGSTSFTSLAGLRASTPEKNSVQIDLSVFSTVPVFPSVPMTMYPKVDLRIKSGSAVENAGLGISGINDVFTGAGPDMGAYEAGVPVPVYGPR